MNKKLNAEDVKKLLDESMNKMLKNKKIWYLEDYEINWIFKFEPSHLKLKYGTDLSRSSLYITMILGITSTKIDARAIAYCIPGGYAFIQFNDEHINISTPSCLSTNRFSIIKNNVTVNYNYRPLRTSFFEYFHDFLQFKHSRLDWLTVVNQNGEIVTYTQVHYPKLFQQDHKPVKYPSNWNTFNFGQEH